MLHNEERELLIRDYEAIHHAEGIAKAYSVSKWTVYQLTEQKRKTGSVALRTSQRGRKPVLTAEDKENIRQCIDEKPDITIEEIREKLSLSASYKSTQWAILCCDGKCALSSCKGFPGSPGGKGNEILYFPPYSPDLNPIEKMWSKMKALLRGWNVQSLDLLPDAVRMALASVSQLDCLHWFAASAYC